MNDTILRNNLIEVLKGVSHPRVKYPDRVRDETQLKSGPLPLLPLAVQSASVNDSQRDAEGGIVRPIQRD